MRALLDVLKSFAVGVLLVAGLIAVALIGDAFPLVKLAGKVAFALGVVTGIGWLTRWLWSDR